eukprot:Gb_30362 [translate_table: standard]
MAPLVASVEFFLIPYCIGSSWVIFTHLQLFHFISSFTPCAGVCTLLVCPFHASATLFPFLLGTMSSFHNAWEDGLVPMVAMALFGTWFWVLHKGRVIPAWSPNVVGKNPTHFIGSLWLVAWHLGDFVGD